eukprot:s2759_g2.t1
MESVASFKSRASEIGMQEELVNRLTRAGVDTFGKLAYICSVNPTSGDDAPLREALVALLGGAPLTPQEMVLLRRLWFESYTLTITELQNKLQRNPNDTPKSIPLAERLVRVEEQKERLKGLVYDQFLEPAHTLTDRVQAMLEDGVVTYLVPEKCVSRHDEIQNSKSEQQLSFDAQGNVKVTKSDAQLQCDVTGELRLRQCLTRKALAFDQIKLCSFDVMEAWHSSMIQALMRKPPSGHKYVTVQQIMAADKELWSFLSQNTRGKLKVTVGQPPALDSEMQTLMTSPTVLCFMTPLPGSQPKAETPKPIPAKPSSPKGGSPKGGSKGQPSGTKRKLEGAPTVKELLQNLPPNCVSKTEQNKFICLHYNNGTCKRQKAASCGMGVHMCYYKNCGKKRPYIECGH